MWYAFRYFLPLNSTHTLVQGHLSIVNSTLIHPVLPIIATAGIERQVLLHSPTPNTPWGSNLPLTPTTTRPLPNGGLTPADPSVLRILMRLSTIIEADDSMGEDARSITYFDMYVIGSLRFTHPRGLTFRILFYVGFCGGKAKGTCLRYGNRRCRRMMMRMMDMRLG
jgi:hypothetical protein